MIYMFAVIALGIVVASNINLTPPMAASRAVLVDQLFNTLLGIAAAIFLLVEGALVYAVFRFRRRKNHQGEGVANHGDNQLELAWTVVPAMIVLWVAIHSAGILTEISTTPPDAMPVRVTGQQFIWQFEYPEYGIQSSTLHVPVDRPVALELTSNDVIHSFWVPAFRLKQDALPGTVTRNTFTAVMTGTFPVRCAELCGVGHSVMTTEVVVHEPADFESWLEEAGG